MRFQAGFSLCFEPPLKRKAILSKADGKAESFIFLLLSKADGKAESFIFMSLNLHLGICLRIDIDKDWRKVSMVLNVLRNQKDWHMY